MTKSLLFDNLIIYKQSLLIIIIILILQKYHDVSQHSQKKGRKSQNKTITTRIKQLQLQRTMETRMVFQQIEIHLRKAKQSSNRRSDLTQVREH